MSFTSPMPSEGKELHDVEAELQRFRLRPITQTTFAPPMEEEFQAECVQERREHFPAQGLISLLLFDLFLLGDYILAPPAMRRAVEIRFALVTLTSLFSAIWLRKHLSCTRREVILALLCLLAFLSVLTLHDGGGTAQSTHGGAGMIFVLVAMNAILRLDAVYALGVTAVCLASEFALVLLYNGVLERQTFSLAARVMLISIPLLYANFTFRREHRLYWLQQRRSLIQQTLLSAANQELVSLSETDRLTGLANRHAYDGRFKKLWEQSKQEAKPLSAVMVDVDHFKVINDTFGHPYGDKVLQRIAALMLQALRAEEDFVARFGGEEFIVLLPDTDAQAAYRVAERIRTLVQVAGSPAVRVDPTQIASAQWSTVSCGTATIVPTAQDDPQQLIAAADAALYRSKQNGRNRVSTGSVDRMSTRLQLVPKHG